MQVKQQDLGLYLNHIFAHKALFWDEMGQVVPRAQLLVFIELLAPRPRADRTPFAIKTTLHIYVLQQRFRLSDAVMKEALFDGPVYRQFAGLGGIDHIPVRISILRLRHLLERHDLAAGLFETIIQVLAGRGLMPKADTEMVAPIISAPSCTKRNTGTHKPEIHQAKKDSQWYFGMTSRRGRTPAGRFRARRCGHERSNAAQNAHIGLDADTGLVHTLTSARVEEHDVIRAHKLLHGSSERNALGGLSFRAAPKRQQVRQRLRGARWHAATMPSKRQKLVKSDEIDQLFNTLERTKTRICAKMKHP